MWDVIVIGSGVGGLATAGTLAAVGGKRVLVLEQHSEPGGLTHTFRRDGAAWDVGLHYVGDLGTGSVLRPLLDFLSGGELRWNRMVPEFERFVYPGMDFRVPNDPDGYRERLIAQFPQQARQIRRYFKDVRAAGRWATVTLTQGALPATLDRLTQAVLKATGKRFVQTTQQYLEENIDSEPLRALLVSQWLDYGLPPARSAFAIHALIVSHYFHGGWFPDGGSARLARTFEKGIEHHGGCVRVSQEVQEILVENGVAVGVRVRDRRRAPSREVSYHAPIVVSAVGARNTYGRLLPRDSETGRLTAGERKRVMATAPGLSAVVLYLTLSQSPTTIGVRGENHWISTSLDHNNDRRRTAALLRGEPEQLYLSFPSLKAHPTAPESTVRHTAEIIAAVEASAFEEWRGRPVHNRGAAYAQVKQTISDGLIRAVEAAVPGFADLVQYSELSTPLSVEHYTRHPGGAFYGVPATPRRYQDRPLGPGTPIENLYLSGQDAGSLGIAGAMMGGIAAATRILPAAFPKLIARMRSPRTPRPPDQRGDKRRAVLHSKRQLTDTIWQVVYDLDGNVGEYAGGQYARLHVGGDEWRDYSIAGATGRRLELLISTSTGGHGSRFILASQPGRATEVELPLGQFTAVPSPRRRVFCATGTGLAPFAAIFTDLAEADELADAELFFGCRTGAEDITSVLDAVPEKVTVCTSRAQPPSGGFPGRVTQALAEAPLDVADTDFYLCGSSAMVADATRVLLHRGAQYIYTEPY